MMSSRYECPCCRYPTLEERPSGTFAICPVCFWEDDDRQFRDSEYAGGANDISLSEARKNFAAFGAIAERYRSNVRSPTSAEKDARAKESQ